MKRAFPKSLYRYVPNMLCYLALPAFFLLFVLLYDPHSIQTLLSAGEGVPGMEGVAFFNLIIVAIILLLVLVLTRNLFFILRRVMNLTLVQYILWCVMELFAMSVFVSVYLVLMDHGQQNWFTWLGLSFTNLLSVLIYPYVIHGTLYGWVDALSNEPADESRRLKFYDSRHQLKFVVSASSILYIASDENYVKIHYAENGVEKQFVLRNSMKSVEDLSEKAGFVRSHRCYIVNPLHIKTIRKDESGLFFVELSGAAGEGVPVSKKYYDSVASVL